MRFKFTFQETLQEKSLQRLPKGQGELFKSSLWFWMLSLRQLFWKFCHAYKILNTFMLGSCQLEIFPVGMGRGFVAFCNWHKVAPSLSGASICKAANTSTGY